MEAVLRHANTSRRRQRITLVAMALILIAGQGIWQFHDSLMLAALVAGAGIIWSSRGKKAWMVAVLIVTAGLAWSSIDPNECSAWWRGKILYEKMVGHLPYMPWSEIRHKAFSRCRSFYQAEAQVKQDVVPLGEKILNGRKLEVYQTSLGPFWIPAPGKHLLAWLLWEMTMQRDYESGGAQIHPGDTVIDGGAHVGVFTRYALQRGAARVIAIEPEPTNIACLEANLSVEIAAGQVQLVKAGIWNEKTYLTLSDSRENSAGHSFVRDVPDSSKLPGLPVVKLDEIVEQLRLDRVDFIKLDIEGAERRALEGARETIRRFKPRMAISSYHMHDDPAAISAVVSKARPGYKIHAKDYEDGPRRLITKVLFFE